MGNQQDYNLTNNQIQVLLTGTFGDGHFHHPTKMGTKFETSSIHMEYILWKKSLLKGILTTVKTIENHGFKEGIIHKCLTENDPRITQIANLSIEDKLKLFTDLGIALWLYDDGSLHKKYGFFNLNTQCFDKEVHYEILVPFFKDYLGITPKVFEDKKLDGRLFYYLYFAKHNGTYEIMKILEKYPINCFKYKLWSSTTIQEWSKLKAELKSRDIEISSRFFANILNGTATLKNLSRYNLEHLYKI